MTRLLRNTATTMANSHVPTVPPMIQRGVWNTSMP